MRLARGNMRVAFLREIMYNGTNMLRLSVPNPDADKRKVRIAMTDASDKRNIPFSPPDISELEIAGAAEALRSGWITTGPRTKTLEKKIAAWVQGYADQGAPRCVCLNSATAALEMALRLLGIGPQEGGSADDEVITCAYTYTASASVVAHVGAKLKLVDCSTEPGSIQMDYDKLEAAITANTKAIIPVDIAGIPCDYDRIFQIVERKRACFRASSPLQEKLGRVAVVADAAHAFGASYHGKMVGSVADFTAYSFHAVKNFTVAEGGALLWNHVDGTEDDELYHQLQLYSLHGQSKDALAKNQLGAWEYDIVGTWYKCNMTDIMAAIGLAQLQRYPGLLARRRQIIEMDDAALKPLGVETLDHYRADRVSSGHLYITRIPGISREQANAVITKMAQRGVATNVHYKPLPMHTAYKKLGFAIVNYPNAYRRFENCVTLPLHTRLDDADVAYVIRNYSQVLREYL